MFNVHSRMDRTYVRTGSDYIDHTNGSSKSHLGWLYIIVHHVQSVFGTFLLRTSYDSKYFKKNLSPYSTEHGIRFTAKHTTNIRTRRDFNLVQRMGVLFE